MSAMWQGMWYLLPDRRCRRMQVILHPAIARFVGEQVKFGRYGTAEEVVNGALSVLQSHEDLSPADLTKLRAEIAHGLAQADRGEFEDWDIDEILPEDRRLLAEERKEAQKKAG